MTNREILSHTADWTPELIEIYEKEIGRIAKEFGLDTYPIQIEIISSEQMMDAYCSSGMPLGYNHWSFGKHFLQIEKHYRKGLMGLAYEIVINSNPSIAYLLEENSMVMQAIVIAHACYGHNSFFKNNYLFKAWTNADSIVDYLLFAKKFIADCEEQYGVEAVEQVLDACHALMNYGIDRYKHPAKLSLREESIRLKTRQEYLQLQVNDLWRTIPKKQKSLDESQLEKFPKEPQENILYFIEKNAPLLEAWQREIVRIVRKIAQYFYPQNQTKLMNEGWACFWHYTLINALYDQGLVTDEFMMEFFQIHTNVVSQQPFDSPVYNGINPYYLGFHIYADIKRMCEQPTEEDRKYFPDVAGKDWLKTLDFAMRNFKDESFIMQYLSPKLIRDLKLFTILDDEKADHLLISAIHNDEGYEHIRTKLSSQYNTSEQDPNIQITNVNLRADRALTLQHIEYQQQSLSKETLAVLKYLYFLWGFPVRLETIDQEGKVKKVYQCPEVPE